MRLGLIQPPDRVAEPGRFQVPGAILIAHGSSDLIKLATRRGDARKEIIVHCPKSAGLILAEVKALGHPLHVIPDKVIEVVGSGRWRSGPASQIRRRALARQLDI
jgi:hypothetical protein